MRKWKGKDGALKRNDNKSGTLASLSVGESAKIETVSPECRIRRRLADLGFSRGNRIICLMRSPLGDPCAYLIRGALIALRRSDAAFVTIVK